MAQLDRRYSHLHDGPQVIDELESTLPRWLMRPGWFPHFVHVLKISPKSTYEINLNSVWSGIGSLQSNLMNAQQVGAGAHLLYCSVCRCQHAILDGI